MEESVSEKPDIPEEQETRLNPLYKPATADSRMSVRFVGNTAVVGTMTFNGVDPYQMLALSRDLERRAFQMLQAAEIEEARRRPKVATTGDMPQGGFKRP
jgi:hypothetical protein